MSIIQGNAKQASTRGFYNFPLEQSLRFNDNDSAYLSWTPASAGDRQKWTWSGWVKRGNLTGSTQVLFASAITSGSTEESLLINSSNQIQHNDGTTGALSVTSATFRDVSAWYHIVYVYDSAQPTQSDRGVWYVNGVRQTNGTNAIGSSRSSYINHSNQHGLGRFGAFNSSYFDGYLAEVNFIDGTALDADSFGELKNGVWIPKDPTGLTYGTNGFRLSFADDAEVEAFNTVLYRGNEDGQSITGMGFQPDLLWIKNRGSAQDHKLMDSVRGLYELEPNQTTAETASDLSSFDSDGFTISGGGAPYNNGGDTYVAWGWKAGTSVSGTTSQSKAYSGSVNTDYGFSIIKYAGSGDPAGTGPAQDVPHHLGQAPDFILVKSLGGAFGWSVYHSSIDATNPADYIIYLHANNARSDQSSHWNDTEPTSTNFTVGTNNGVNDNRYDHIAYCWAEKAGYSKFGSYAGNATSVDLGFNPAFILIKRITGTGKDWWVFDNTREVDGEFGNYLLPNQNYSEQTVATAISVSGNTITFPNNWDSTHDGSSSSTYIYAAFADTREAAFWLDQSGNDNDWQPVNLDHNDTVADSPTDNFATLNPLELNYVTLSDGNLVVQESGGSWRSIRANFMMPTGQWYWEFEGTVSGSNYFGGGVSRLSEPLNNYVGGSANGYGILAFNGNKYNSGAATAFTSAFTVGDVIGVAFDADAGTLEYYKNGTSLGTAFTGLTSGDFFPAFTVRSSTVKVNFGQQPFKYDPPA